MEEGERPRSGLSYADAEGSPLGSADFYGPDEAVDKAEDEIFERIEAEHREQERRLLQPVR